MFAHCYNVGPPPSQVLQDRANKRPRPEQHLNMQRQGFAPRAPGRMPMYRPATSILMEPEHLRLMSRVILQQEEVIAHLRQEKCFVMFMKHEQEGILRPLMMVAKEWNDKKNKSPELLDSPLRTLMLQSMLQELLNRVQKEAATEEGRATLMKRGWLTAEHHWPYLRWDRKAKQLVQDPRPPLQHSELTRLLTWMLKELKGEIIQTFKSTMPLHKVDTQLVPTTTFKLEISLRGQTALEMHEAFNKLAASAATLLIGVSIKRDTLPQTPAARQLADLTYRRR